LSGYKFVDWIELKGGTDAKEGIYAGAEGILTPDPLLAKPSASNPPWDSSR